MNRTDHLPLLRLLPWLLLGLAPLRVFAAGSDWGLCDSQQPPALPELGSESDQSLRLSADHVQAQGDTLSRFSGDVVLLRSGKRLEADEAVYDKRRNVLNLSGNVRIYSRDLSASGETAHLNIDDNSGQLQNARYRFRFGHASGSADTITIADLQHTALEGATYTTCNPDKVDWLLSARSINLDRATNTGEARNVTVEFKGVPFIYLPYLNFPLEGRKSGLLAPTLGNSDKSGTDISIPYYWNIAPNQDATITPRYLSARGAMLMGEYRYLTRHNNGKLNIDALPNDSRDNGRDRLHGSLTHYASFDNGWSGNAVYNYVSDSAYFNDLGNSQASASTTHLERRLDLNYQGTGWNFLGRVQGYQTLSGSEPYQRLPQLRVAAASPRHRNTLSYALDSELVHFASSDLVPTGTRLDLKPTLSLPLEGDAWFLTPQVALRHTQYELKNNPGGDSLSRTLPIASLDSGLYYERAAGSDDHPMVQTLEPRLYYLYVPYKDQSNLPVFDTAAYDFSFGQLFRDNRFSGADRQADANQVTLALTTRLQDGASGEELARASIGQIHYFADRRVTLPTTTTAERQSSDLVAELGARPGQGVDLSATTRWNPHDERTEVLTTRARYRPDQDRLLSFDYRYRRDQSLRQTDLIAYWPVARRWRVLARWNYDLEAKRTLETVGGLAYEDCCWALHFVLRQRLDTVSLTTDHSFFLTLELKGLSTLGRSLEDELEHGILRR